jgi:S-adenosyl-L-methionine hydrolase (adenosine-forming)
LTILSLSSDLGENNFNLAQLQARLKMNFPNESLVDLFHHNEIYDIESIAYQVYGALHTFPDESIHLIYCKYSVLKSNLLICKLRNQFVICPNNGILSLLHSIDFNAKVYSLDVQTEFFNIDFYISNSFKAIESVMNNSYLQLTESVTFIQTKPFNTDLKRIENKIITRVLHTDKLGNIVLNITENEFKETTENKGFTLVFHTVKLFQISPNYSTAYNPNKIGAIFNSAGFLELFMIGMNLSNLFNINKFNGTKFEIIIDNDTNRQINF